VVALRCGKLTRRTEGALAVGVISRKAMVEGSLPEVSQNG
jgi:hypothetical protein